MTVLYLHSSAGRYGADRQLLLLVERSQRPARVWLPMDGPLVEDLRAAGAEVEIRALPVIRREHMNGSGLRELRRQIKATAFPDDVALIHANTSVIIGAGKKGTVPFVSHVREIWPARMMARAAVRRADAIVCVSEAVRAQFGSDERARVIHDGLPYTPHRADRTEARRALGISEDGFVVAVAGRISAWKGQEVLARALVEVPDAVGVAAGDVWPGQEHHEAALLAAAEPLGERFRVLGFREDVENVYGAADVVVVPSTKPDPLPNAALEAAAAGCCVVAADHGGLPEIIRDGQTGRLFAPGDASALAAILNELAADRLLTDRLGRAAAADVAQRFTPERMAEGVEALYRSLL